MSNIFIVSSTNKCNTPTLGVCPKRTGCCSASGSLTKIPYLYYGVRGCATGRANSSSAKPCISGRKWAVAAIAQTQKEIALTDFAKNIEQSAQAHAEVQERFAKTSRLVHEFTQSSGRELKKAFADFVKHVWPYFKRVEIVGWPRRMISLRVLHKSYSYNRLRSETLLCLRKNGKFCERNNFWGENSGCWLRTYKKLDTLEVFKEYGVKRILQLMHGAVESQIPLLENKIKELEAQRESVERLRF